jgi:VWFA-related protein
MRSLPVLLAIVSTAALATAPVPARTQQRRVDPSQPTFRVGTRLVQVSVIVHDGRRRPVEGLTREDFQVFEDGREQRVALFDVHSRGGSSAHPLPGASETGTAEAGTFTNRIPTPAASGVVAIIFDQLNMPLQAQTRAREQLLRYLRTLRPTDRVALYVLTSDGIRLLYDFTNDAGTLVATLNRVPQRESLALAASQDQLSPALTQDLSAFAAGNLLNTAAHFNRLRSETTINALEAVGLHLEGIPGRKNIIWISSGFPIRIGVSGPSGAPPSPMTGETGRATRALNNSDAAVYPIDARGLLPPVFAKEASQLGMLHVPIEGLKAVADWTGGRLFFNTNDLTDAMSQAVADSRVAYMLGYYSTSELLDGRFRRIKVTVRRLGVEVRHRSGYFADDRVGAMPGDRQVALTAALNSPLSATGLPLVIRPARKPADRVELAIDLPPGTPALFRGNDAWSGAVDVLVAQTTDSGDKVRDMDATQAVALTDQGRTQVQQKGMRLVRTITLRPGALDIRVVVRDATTGAIGSVVIPIAAVR